MPTTLTLKNVPDSLYARLKTAALAHRRSLNSEAIVSLESVLMPRKLDSGEHVARARALRATLASAPFDTPDIDSFKREGRP
jgi:antitoxin FitA